MSRLAAAATLLVGVVLVACGTAAPEATSSPTPFRTPQKTTLNATTVRGALEAADRATFRVTYSVNGVFNRVALGGSWVVYRRPPFQRVDIAVGTTGEFQRTSMYLSPTAIVLCPMPYRPPCRELTPDEAMNGGFGAVSLDQPLRDDPRVFERAERTEDRIAGQDVTCFLVRQAGQTKADGTSIEACYTVDGIPLRIGVITSVLQIELNATIVIREVSESDVRPPPGALQR